MNGPSLSPTALSTSPLLLSRAVLDARKRGSVEDQAFLASVASLDLQHRMHFLKDTLPPESLAQWQVDGTLETIRTYWTGSFPPSTSVHYRQLDPETRRARVVWKPEGLGGWVIELQAFPHGWTYHNSLWADSMQGWSESESLLLDQPFSSSVQHSQGELDNNPLDSKKEDEEEEEDDDDYWDQYGYDDESSSSSSSNGYPEDPSSQGGGSLGEDAYWSRYSEVESTPPPKNRQEITVKAPDSYLPLPLSSPSTDDLLSQVSNLLSLSLQDQSKDDLPPSTSLSVRDEEDNQTYSLLTPSSLSPQEAEKAVVSSSPPSSHSPPQSREDLHRAMASLWSQARQQGLDPISFQALAVSVSLSE
ncbi:MAG: hypothetical protein DHS80DRAFT_30916 [Piptocephalis tieghemiana]|nr:MAG: hypothetical protein DHS80DRAFT_30916 [Piptocephalis tieghemiana]